MVKQTHSGCNPERAEREGFGCDPFCLQATAFGRPAAQGAMGVHATDEARLRGPIEVDRPQPIMFEADGRVLGVAYEVTTDAVSEAPELGAPELIALTNGRGPCPGTMRGGASRRAH